MRNFYAIRRLSDGQIICRGIATAPLADMIAPEGCEVLPFRPCAEHQSLTAEQAAQLTERAATMRPSDRDSVNLTS
jgi:hypothetical protein